MLTIENNGCSAQFNGDATKIQNVCQISAVDILIDLLIFEKDCPENS